MPLVSQYNTGHHHWTPRWFHSGLKSPLWIPTSVHTFSLCSYFNLICNLGQSNNGLPCSFSTFPTTLHLRSSHSLTDIFGQPRGFCNHPAKSCHDASCQDGPAKVPPRPGPGRRTQDAGPNSKGLLAPLGLESQFMWLCMERGTLVIARRTRQVYVISF